MAGANVNQAGESGGTPLHTACQVRRAPAALAVPSSVNPSSRTSLTSLASSPPSPQHGHVDILDLLLGAGADVNQTKLSGLSAVFVACHAGHLNCVNRLIAAKADVHRANHKGITPLFTACRHGHEACARAVLAEGASVDARSNGGLTAMQNAAARGHLSCVQLLSAHSADRGGNAPQRYAAHFGHHHIVTWLQRSQFWTTPLHHADIIDRKTAYDLLRGGASISVRARR